MAVTGAVGLNTVAALTVTVLELPLVPKNVLPRALNVLLAATVVSAFKLTGAVKEDTACTVRLWLLVAPSTTLPLAVSKEVIGSGEANVVAALTVRVWLPEVPRTVLPAAVRVLLLPLTVTAALAVMGAVDAKVVAALIVRVWLPDVPKTVLPATLRVEVEVVTETLPVKLARPALLMLRRSTGCPLLLLVLPAVVVLNTRLPPVLPVVSCNQQSHIIQAVLL